ncbi:sensor histidine kinase [Flavobacterium facile]|uniref:sensor histidine kinase n=1 Tax=Flavobacterium facile TaxID=2893174 RepID=UPI002E777D12|nr:two-component regulator propeller domain-containing protein [Flavobacterium sp. T-12]
MPSNHIYEIIEDNNGFLWIGTDNGISRFDGKRFVNYTTKDGLPSNDGIQIIKEKNGTIWVNCYKQPPSYFDEKNNKFVSFEKDVIVVKNSSSLLYPYNNLNGGVYFSNTNGSMFFNNKKLAAIYKTRFNNLFIESKQFYLQSEFSIKNGFTNKYSIYNSNNKLIGQIISKNQFPTFNLKIEGNLIFEIFKNEIILYEIIQTKPFQFVKKKISFKETLKWYCLSESELSVITNLGKVLVYDLNKFNLKHTISTNKEINYSYKDSKGTIWISTLNNGLLKFNRTTIKTIADVSIDPNFLSIYVNDSNTLFAGNFKGDILEKSNKTNNKSINDRKNTTWIRFVSSFKNKIITVSDLGYCINYGSNTIIFNTNKQSVSLKTALKLNDSILILGSNTGLFKLNVLKNKCEHIKSPHERVLSIAKIDSKTFYFTANSGVYKYHLNKEIYSVIFSNSKLKNDNIQSITLGKNGSLWFNTFKGNLYLIKNNILQFCIINSDKLPINITKIQEIDKQLWIASKDGIYILDISDLPKYSINKISKSDGLTSNFINDFTCKNDSVYIATNNGISILSKNIKSNTYSILPIIISAKINNLNVPIQTIYNLDKEQKNIILELAGVDLTGHFNRFQYAINNENWYDIEGNILNLLLKSGENNIKIRAVDENNHISKRVLQVNFNVAIPFYKKIGFQLFLPFLLSGILFFFYNRRKFEKQKIAFTQQLELEKQRSKITADLHDEIGSTLSSLQINSTVANKLMEKDIPSAQKVLLKVESQAKSLAEKIGDIIWSMKPGKDEFMTLSTRIKNFCNEVLGSTDINYVIEIDKKIDFVITDFAARKNILLITKEAVNNALKYSKATNILISIQYENNMVLLVISDNGIGFKTNEIIGNGIGNMKSRANELNASFEIISIEITGTTIQLEFKVIP